MAKRTAIIDIGSNSIRMVVYEKTSRFAFHILHEAKFRARISENAYKNSGYLQDKATQRVYKALQAFQQAIKQYKATKTLCIATSAIRDAPNKKDFIYKIQKELNLNIKVIDGEREAYLGGIAAANLLYLNSAITVDIGGGSTELAIYKDKKVVKMISLNLGTVRLKEMFFDNSDIDGAKQYISSELDRLDDEFISDDIVGIGGTLRALSKMIMDKDNVSYKKLHGFEYSTSKNKDYLNEIILSDDNGLKKLGVKSDRLDVIQPGVLIVSALIKHMKAKKIITSGVGLREGIFLSDLLRSQGDKFPHNYNPSIKSLEDRFLKDNIKDLSTKAGKAFDLLHSHLKIDHLHKTTFLQALKLSDIGKELDFYEAPIHGYNILLNSLNYKFTHKQIVLISTLVRFQDKKAPNSSHLQKYSKYLPNEETTQNLCFLVSLCKVIYEYTNNNIDLQLKENCLYIRTDNKYIIEENIKETQANGLLEIIVVSNE